MKKVFLRLGIIILSASCLFCNRFPERFDLIIKGGLVYDGTGRKAARTDIGIADGRITVLRKNIAAPADRIIDAAGLVVAPGFIDLHTHAERGILQSPAVENYIRQGVTTVVGGNCGGSPHPIEAFMARVDSAGSAINLALLVGHNTVRAAVMGTEDRAPAIDEMEGMKSLVRHAMEAGGFGLSLGLKYVPGAYADTEEVVELAEVAAGYGGFFATHMRDEERDVIAAVRETIEIGREAGIPIHISHHKVMGRSMWGTSEKTLALIDAASDEGLDITFDQYPYTATSTGLTVLFPAWSLAGGVDRLKDRLDEPETRREIKEAVVEALAHGRGGGDPASITVTSHRGNPSLAGKNLAEITEMRGRDPTVENAAESLIELMEEGGGSGIYHCLDEEDVVRIMMHPSGAIGSDGGSVRYGERKVHPRNYGTFPRVLGRYVREQKILEMEEAIRKMTSLPARRLGLDDRGIMKRGAWADIVVFDAEEVIDQATYLEPHRYPAGILFVLVNGTPVIEDGEYTGAMPGVMLKHRH